MLGQRSYQFRRAGRGACIALASKGQVFGERLVFPGNNSQLGLLFANHDRQTGAYSGRRGPEKPDLLHRSPFSHQYHERKLTCERHAAQTGGAAGNFNIAAGVFAQTGGQWALLAPVPDLFGTDPKDVYQQTSAQYVIFTKADQNAN